MKKLGYLEGREGIAAEAVALVIRSDIENKWDLLPLVTMVHLLFLSCIHIFERGVTCQMKAITSRSF